jgi:hypothetical protein
MSLRVAGGGGRASEMQYEDETLEKKRRSQAIVL